MVVDDKGEIVESKASGTLLMPKEDIEASAGMWATVMRGVSERMEKHLGNPSGLSIYYDKVTAHGMPIGDKTIVITARKDMPLETVLSLKEIAEA